ncbi:MAG: Na+/H+ antiporter NhaA [Bacteroidetes bacterium]|nr:Na+/H+ antiporter NhaA [Bacteroidota bacterium]
MRITRVFTAFFESEKAGGLVLILATLLSLILANSPLQIHYVAFWEQPIGSHSLSEWINDGLMAIFFLLIGLELERELYKGELSSLKNATLPLVGALGGMVVPAVLFTGFNWGLTTQSGAGIPMATDIAFAIGILSLLGKKVPTSLKVFLTALAVIDDLGAILIIAIFYTKTISFAYLLGALSIWSILLILNRLKIHHLLPYLIGGILMWYCMLHSGVHATITGVLLAFALPFGNGSKKTLSYKVQNALHLPVAFVILPLFALANTGIIWSGTAQDNFTQPVSLGIIAGLIIGKPMGIWLFSKLGAMTKICSLPDDLKWSHIIGAGFLGGIGFTMSIFITLLAFADSTNITHAKMSILLASLVAGSIGFAWLKKTLQS